MTEAASFIQRLNRTKTLSLKLSDLLTEGFRGNRFEGHETFISPGNYASSIYYIESGLIRGAIETKADKMTTWFKSDGDLIIPQGVINQQQSEEYVSAIIKTNLISLPIRHLKKVSETYPEVQELIILLLCENAKDAQYREKLLRFPTAKERYDFLIEHEPYVLKRIPHFLIASYLNVTKETFSHLIKGLPY